MWNLLLDISPTNTPPGDLNGEVIYPRFLLSPEEASRICISVFGKRLSRKSYNSVLIPFAFHIAVQQPFKPLWSRLLLYDLQPSQASFVQRFKSLLMTLFPALEKFLLHFPSSRYLSSSGSHPLDLTGVGDPAGSNATAVIAVRVTGTHKLLHHDKVGIPSGVFPYIEKIFINNYTFNILSTKSKFSHV
jgi:hypothetical protein